MLDITNVYHTTECLMRQATTPIHIFKTVISDCLALVCEFQIPDQPLYGVLTGILMDCLISCKVPIHDFISQLEMSPSFYTPINILKYAPVTPQDSASEFLILASSFHCFESWVLTSTTSYYADLCYNHCIFTNSVNDILQFARFHLQLNNNKFAIQILLLGSRFKNPIIFRILARLHITLNPIQALGYARQAISLGDIDAKTILALLLDNPKIPKTLCDGQISSNRVKLISRVIFKIDPVFATNASTSDSIRQTKFTSFIAGTILKI